MNELLQIEETVIGNMLIKTVNAKILWKFLESKQKYSDWIKWRIDQFNFIQEEDYTCHKIMTEYNQPLRIDYFISIDMAKELSMIERNTKGKQARLYFIECEKKLKTIVQQPQFNLPTTYIEALESLLISEKEKIQLQIENKQKQTLIEIQQPKVDYYNTVTASTQSLDMNVVAKTLDMGYGRTKLFELLRQYQVLDANNIPYQKYINRKYFEVVQSTYKTDTHIFTRQTTRVFQKGMDFIRKLILTINEKEQQNVRN